ncbi:2Fe-2S iron-sulfur cluster-binding protein [Variovorax sp. DT-64]|uniref:2Fe-2S iron-sulfur cluster-binding protein n=1 Tax=Variovorax sp. DT-64 TaxID=3396160 RepID=UPI003F1CCF80
MTSVKFIEPDGNEETINAADGMSVMSAATASGVRGIIGECGGNLSCASCHVFVHKEWFHRLDPIGDLEDEMLNATSEDRTDCSRLSCQIVVKPSLEGMTVTVPPSQQ